MQFESEAVRFLCIIALEVHYTWSCLPSIPMDTTQASLITSCPVTWECLVHWVIYPSQMFTHFIIWNKNITFLYGTTNSIRNNFQGWKLLTLVLNRYGSKSLSFVECLNSIISSGSALFFHLKKCSSLKSHTWRC